MKKTTVRVLSILLVALMVLGLISSALVMLVSAADEAQIIPADTTVSRTMTTGKVSTGLTVKFNFLAPTTVPVDGDYRSGEFIMAQNSAFGWSFNTKLTIKDETKKVSGVDVDYYSATITNVSYNGSGTGPLVISLLDSSGSEFFTMSVAIPIKYFKETEATDGAPTSDIVVQNTVVQNAAGQTLDTVNKNSGPLKVEVTFYDIGLKDEGNTSIDAAKKYAFITSTSGLRLHSGSSGTVERVSGSSQFPRFKATFEGVEYTGGGNTLSFRVLYDFEEYEASIPGKADATLFQIKAEEEDETAVLTPKLIISEYSYGKEAIIAGEEFNLDLSFYNTSGDIAVENIDMTIEPGSGFLITAASNTAYFPSLAPSEAKNFSIGLKANPAVDTSIGTATDYSINIKFSYQFLNDKKTDGSTSSVKIAIPVTQLDRFGVDEITDYSQYMNLGEEGYVSVPITNKGKSTTYNITGEIVTVAASDCIAAPVHFGNLEAGKSDVIDISLTVNTPGEFQAMAVITYEDENMNQKKIAVDFTIMVMEPQPPQMEMPPMNPDGDISQQGPGLASIIFCAVGALMMAVPVALYLIKRVKAKGSEDVDEDF